MAAADFTGIDSACLSRCANWCVAINRIPARQSHRRSRFHNGLRRRMQPLESLFALPRRCEPLRHRLHVSGQFTKLSRKQFGRSLRVHWRIEPQTISRSNRRVKQQRYRFANQIRFRVPQRDAEKKPVVPTDKVRPLLTTQTVPVEEPPTTVHPAQTAGEPGHLNKETSPRISLEVRMTGMKRRIAGGRSLYLRTPRRTRNYPRIENPCRKSRSRKRRGSRFPRRAQRRSARSTGAHRIAAPDSDLNRQDRCCRWITRRPHKPQVSRRRGFPRG